MANNSHVGHIAFQQRLLEEEHKKLKIYLQNADLGIDKEQYLEICEATSQKPDPEKMPLEFDDLILDTQLAMSIVSMLPDTWDGTSGMNTGKDLTLLPYILDLHGITNKLDMLALIMQIISEAQYLTNRKNKQVNHGKK